MKHDDRYLTMRSAFLTAFPKIFTDIPYGSEIFNKMIKPAISNGFSFEPDMFVPKMSLEIEARYKAISLILKDQLQKTNNAVIADLGAGVSPRRLEFIEQKDYYELDYKPILEIKHSLYCDLGFSDDMSKLIDVDFSDEKAFEESINTIIQRSYSPSLILVTEGVFWYLSIDTLYKMAKTIKRVLRRHGGCWIVGDTPVNEDTYCLYEYRKAIAKSANKDMNKPFGCIQEFNGFFSSLDYRIESFTLQDIVDIGELVSGKLFSLNEKEIQQRLQAYTNISLLK